MDVDLTYLEQVILYSTFKFRDYFVFATKPLKESNSVPYRIEQTIEGIENKVGKKLVVPKPKSMHEEGSSFDSFSNKNIEKYLGRRYAGQR